MCDGVMVYDGVMVIVDVNVMVAVLDGVAVLLGVGVMLAVALALGVSVGPGNNADCHCGRVKKAPISNMMIIAPMIPPACCRDRWRSRRI